MKPLSWIKKLKIRSLETLIPYEIDTIICYHGGEYCRDNLQAEISQIIKRRYAKA